jgi:hypothetical protein
MAESPNYSLQETVDGQVVTYDAAGNALAKNFAPTGPKPVETLLWRRKGENEMRVRDVNTHSNVHVKVKVGEPGAPCNYFIDWRAGTWTRNGVCSSISGNVTDLEIREDEAGDPWLEIQLLIDQSAEIVLKAGRTSCIYRFNKVTQRYERICS